MGYCRLPIADCRLRLWVSDSGVNNSGKGLTVLFVFIKMTINILFNRQLAIGN
jgi:hypothetical protein